MFLPIIKVSFGAYVWQCVSEFYYVSRQFITLRTRGFASALKGQEAALSARYMKHNISAVFVKHTTPVHFLDLGRETAATVGWQEQTKCDHRIRLNPTSQFCFIVVYTWVSFAVWPCNKNLFPWIHLSGAFVPPTNLEPDS